MVYLDVQVQLNDIYFIRKHSFEVFGIDSIRVLLKKKA